MDRGEYGTTQPGRVPKDQAAPRGSPVDPAWFRALDATSVAGVSMAPPSERHHHTSFTPPANVIVPSVTALLALHHLQGYQG